MNINEIRKQIPITDTIAYLNNGAVAPLPKYVAERMQEAMNEQMFKGSYWQQWVPKMHQGAELFGKLIGAKGDEVGYTPNVSTATWIMAPSLAQTYPPDANIVMTDLEFPTSAFTWLLQKKQGKVKEIRLLKSQNGAVDVEQFEKAVDDKTAVVATHSASFVNGHRQNLQAISEIAHAHGAKIVVDAYQSVGLIPMDVKRANIDVLISGTYKWLMGPPGHGYMFVNEKIVNEIEPAVIGWFGTEDGEIEPFDYTKTAEPLKNARRFESGSFSVVAAYGAEAALKFALENDTTSHFDRIQTTLQQRIIDGCTELGLKIQSPLDREKRGGTINVGDKDAAKTMAKLRELNICVSKRYVPGLGPGIRVSPHFYNTMEEIEKFLDAMKKLKTAQPIAA